MDTDDLFVQLVEALDRDLELLAVLRYRLIVLGALAGADQGPSIPTAVREVEHAYEDLRLADLVRATATVRVAEVFDLDPMPQCGFDTVRRVAGVAREVLDELGAVGWPKTSGGRGLHVYVRIEPRWGFADLRRAAHAFACEVERRAPADVTTTWWRKDRDPRSLFIDYNQNTRDHTIASAYSVRGVPEATVSTPISWDEVDDVDPREFTIATVPDRFIRLGDLHAGIDDHPYSIEPLLDWADRDGLT